MIDQGTAEPSSQDAFRQRQPDGGAERLAGFMEQPGLGTEQP